MKKLFFCLVVTLLFCSCKDALLDEDFKGGDWFYLENKGATMPVWVKGNIQSETFIIFIGGGPGYSSVEDIPLHDAFRRLQNHYALVCWDQRGCGLSQGNAKPETLTLKQFVEDLEKLVVLIRHKYNNPTLFLMGHSWGGMLGSAFLMNPINQTHVSGWIDISGMKNTTRDMMFFVEWVIEKAEEQINLGIDVDYWKDEIAWYNSRVPPLTYDIWQDEKFWERNSKNAGKFNAWIHDPSSAPGISIGLNSPCPLFDFLNSFYIGKNMHPNLFGLSVVREIENIKIPSLIMGGKHDGNIPVKIAHETYEKIGSDNKYLYIFENAAHMSFYEEPELFSERVKLFINKYK